MNYRPVNANIVYNLRYRWRNELSAFSDEAICHMYEDFSNSEDYGNNDELLPKWFDDLPYYQERLEK